MTGHIQVGDVAPRVQYVANGSQTVFPYPFPIFTESDIEVWIGAARVAASAYFVAGAGSSEGGAVTLAAPPPPATIVTLRRRLTLRRTSDFHDDGIIRAKVVNDEFDYQTMSVQQVAEDVDRAVKRAHTSSSKADLTLPDPVPGRAIKWNDDASGLENSAIDVDQVLAQATGGAAEAEASAASAAVSAMTATARAADATSAASTATAAADRAVALVGFTLDCDPTLAANSDSRIATQKAVRAYAESAAGQATNAAIAAIDPLKAQIALANLRQLLTSSVASGALVQGYQWELATNEWSASTGQTLVTASPNYYTNAAYVRRTFAYTGALQSEIVPAGAVAATVKLWGAGGGATTQASPYNDYGGAGGFTTATIPVTPGQTLAIIVGQGGWNNTSSTFGGGGGVSGTTDSGHYPGTGGGYTGLFKGSVSQANALALAGGGGGAGNKSDDGWSGGAGGGTSGEASKSSVEGGTQTQGGRTCNPGSALQGGNGTNGAGGGGGGYYGGAGGNVSYYPGGGGSGYITPGATNAAFITSPDHVSAPNTTDPAYPGGIVGAGGKYSLDTGRAGNGYAVITYTIKSDMVLTSDAIPVASAPAYASLHALYRDDSGTAVLGTDLTAEISRDGGASWTAAAIAVLAAYDGTYALIRARAALTAQPVGTALVARIKTLNLKAQRIAAPALYAE